MRALLMVMLAGCGEENAPLDLREDFPDPPAGGWQIRTEPMVIPSGQERFFCYFVRYEGEDVGITSLETFQNDFGHHNQLMITTASEREFPDGTMFDCTGQAALSMVEAQPLVMSRPIEQGHTKVDLPEGMAVKLASGTRLMVQSHYVNASADDIRVEDAMNLALVPAADVALWGAAFVHVGTDFALPPHEETSLTVDCTWDADESILFLLGHMHEQGVRYAIDWTSAAGTERIYEVAQWSPVYRNEPPQNDYTSEPFAVHAGDHFVTTCTWQNETDDVLEFPEEMCATVGIAYPTAVPIICNPS
jgi:hypothetical protein